MDLKIPVEQEKIINEGRERKGTPKQRFKRALSILSKERPFIRGIVSQCKPTFDKKIPSACLKIRQDRKFKMYFNPDFVDAQRYTEHVSGVIHHEINHLIRGHLLIDRTGLDEDILNLSLEIHANMDIPKSWLPPQTEDGEALTRERFNIPESVRNWKEIYTKLFKRFGKKKKRTAGQKQLLKSLGVGKLKKSKGTGHGEPQVKGKMPKKLKKKLSDPTEIKSMMAKLLNKVWKEKVEDNIKNNDLVYLPMSDEELKSLQEIVNQIPGLASGMMQILISDRESKIDWKRHLRHFITSIRTRASSYRKPNKRFQNLMGIVPGRDLKAGRCNLLIGIDTSGSCVGYVPDFIAEIKKLSRYADGVCVEWDAREMDSYKLKDSKKKTSFKGGGGTDFREFLKDEKIKEIAKKFNVRRFDGIVFLTDLWAYLPTQAPMVPLLWFITPNNKNPQVHFGKIVKMEN